MIPKDRFDELVKKNGSDSYYKSFFSWDQLVTMLFGIYSRCDSMGEVCDSMRALGGKLNHLGMDCSPAKSTAGDALRNRSEELFRLFYTINRLKFKFVDLSFSRLIVIKYHYCPLKKERTNCFIPLKRLSL